MLNILWPIFIIISIVYAFFSGNIEKVNECVFSSTEHAVEFSLILLGTISLWNGMMEIVSNTKIIYYLSKALQPVIRFLFPDVNGEEAKENIIMNMIANILGLGNAATPLGIRAIKELQKENMDKTTLSDSMMMLIILNTSSLQIIPVTILSIRNSLNSNDSTMIIVPIWIATICSAIFGIASTKILIERTKNK